MVSRTALRCVAMRQVDSGWMDGRNLDGWIAVDSCITMAWRMDGRKMVSTRRRVSIPYPPCSSTQKEMDSRAPYLNLLDLTTPRLKGKRAVRMGCF